MTGTLTCRAGDDSEGSVIRPNRYPSEDHRKGRRAHLCPSPFRIKIRQDSGCQHDEGSAESEASHRRQQEGVSSFVCVLRFCVCSSGRLESSICYVFDQNDLKPKMGWFVKSVTRLLVEIFLMLSYRKFIYIKRNHSL